MNPQAYKAEPDFRRTDGVWIQGYSFKHFWGNCAALLGDVARIGGIQQLCHQYYLQNGALGATIAVQRIKKFIN